MQDETTEIEYDASGEAHYVTKPKYIYAVVRRYPIANFDATRMIDCKVEIYPCLTMQDAEEVAVMIIEGSVGIDAIAEAESWEDAFQMLEDLGVDIDIRQLSTDQMDHLDQLKWKISSKEELLEDILTEEEFAEIEALTRRV